MAIQDILQCLAVTGSLPVLLVVPFLFLASVLIRNREWPVIILSALIFGCSVQAVSGLLWSHIVRGQPFSEFLFFLVICLVLTILGLGLRWRLAGGNEIWIGSQGHGFLVVILAAAFTKC